jgi:hypothetical protein
MDSCLFSSWRALILFVTNLLHPVGRFTVELFENGHVRHSRGGSGAVPMLFAGRKPNHVARPNLFDWTSPALGQAGACGYDQSLTQRMSMPGSPSGGLERNTGTKHASWIVRFEQWINADSAGKIVRGSFAGRLGARSFDVHGEGDGATGDGVVE